MCVACDVEKKISFIVQKEKNQIKNGLNLKYETLSKPLIIIFLLSVHKMVEIKKFNDAALFYNVV